MDEWMTVQQAMAHLKVSRATLYNYCDRGLLPYYDLQSGGGRRFKRADLDGLLRPGSSWTWVSRIKLSCTPPPPRELLAELLISLDGSVDVEAGAPIAVLHMHGRDAEEAQRAAEAKLGRLLVDLARRGWECGPVGDVAAPERSYPDEPRDGF